MLDIKEIQRGSSLYPAHLESIMAPPRTLWAVGNLGLLNTPGVSVVGARDASRVGLTIAERISSFLAMNNIPVVSGLALGVDAAAHRGAIKVAGPTIAVLASGVDNFTPKTNMPLAQEILNKGGLIVSEQAPGTPAKRQNFVPRNRIQVGLSNASIIVECAEKSGTMTHAKFCLEERHPLFTVIPNDATLAMNLSGAKLLQTMGAHIITSKEDYSMLLLKAHKSLSARY
jgi:DNA processing protein